MISFLKKYSKKFVYAFAGLWDGLYHDRSILTQVLLGCVVIFICSVLSLTKQEWMIIIVVIGFVIAMEFMNSAIEQIVDFICPTWDERAKKIKDYAAAAVLVASTTAAIIGLLVIGGKIF